MHVISEVSANDDGLLFLPLFLSTMSGDSLKRRKIAVLGSRSVGTCTIPPIFRLLLPQSAQFVFRKVFVGETIH